MPLIKDGRLIDDSWATVADDAPLPLEARSIVSLERWRADRDALLRRNAPLGLRLRSDQSPALIADDLAHFAVVALEFPKFTDGRAFSYARLLRERYSYRGEVRAVGAPALDQALFLRRCGFDSIEVADGASAAAWFAAEQRISVAYQPAADGLAPAYRLRQSRPESSSSAPAGRDIEPPTVDGKIERPRHAAATPEPCFGQWAY